MMQKERFEHHQEMLERFTENLSELSEKPLAEMSRTDVVNQVRYPFPFWAEKCAFQIDLLFSINHVFCTSSDPGGGSFHEKHFEVR